MAVSESKNDQGMANFLTVLLGLLWGFSKLLITWPLSCEPSLMLSTWCEDRQGPAIPYISLAKILSCVNWLLDNKISSYFHFDTYIMAMTNGQVTK